jgi:flagellar biosynthetic protein FliQ
MNFSDVLEITQQALWTTLKVGAPLLIITLIVGLVISLFQALTQIQESTLSFVPKVIAVLPQLRCFFLLCLIHYKHSHWNFSNA